MLTLPQYQVLEEVHSSEHTVIAKAVNIADQKPVILKTLVQGQSLAQLPLRRLYHHYSLSQGLQHSGLLKCLSLDYFAQKPVLYTEDFGGISLDKYLISNSIKISEILNIILQISDVLQFLSQQSISHNAIRLDHILIHPNNGKIWLIDFSQAQCGQQTQQNDLFALGQVFYLLLQKTFSLPDLAIASPPSLASQPYHCALLSPGVLLALPAAVTGILRRLLDGSGFCQYPNALSLQRDLRHCLGQLEATGELKHCSTEIELPQRENAFALASLLPRLQGLVAILDIEELVESCFRCLVNYAGADSCAFARWDVQADWQVYHWDANASSKVEVGSPMPLLGHQQVPVNLLLRCHETGESTVAHANVQVKALALQEDYLRQHRQQPQALLAVPVQYQGERYGVLYLEHRWLPMGSSQDCQAIVDFLANQMAIALRNAGLQDSLAPRSAAIEASLDGVAILDNGHYRYVNPAYAQLFGYELEELIGQTWNHLYPDSELELIQGQVLRSLCKSRQWRGESRGLHKDGSSFDQEITLFLLEDKTLICICRDISERKAAEEALEFTQFAVNNSAFSTFWIDQAGSLSSPNEAAVEMLGYSAEALTQMKIWNIDVHLKPERWASHWVSLQLLPNQVFESQHRSQTGRILPVEISTNYVKYRGKAYNFVQVQEISARKQAEAELHRSQQLLQLVLDTIPQKVFWKDRSSTYLGCNQLFADVAGLSSPAAIVGISDDDLPWKPGEREFFISHDQRVMLSGQAELGVVESKVTKNGQKCWLETNTVPLYDDDKNVIGVLGTFQDITPQKEAEKTLKRVNEELERRVFSRTIELQESQQFLQLIMDTIPLAIFWKDRNSAYLGCNREALYMTGFSSPEEIIGKTDEDLPWSAQKVEEIRQGDIRIMETDTPELAIEESLLQVDGTQAWLETSKVPIHNVDGNPMGVLVTFQDITPRKEAESALQEINRELTTAKDLADAASLAKSEFLASMSHELRTPLNGILGYAQILSRSETLTEKEQDGVIVIRESGEHLLTLINEILDLAKIEAGKLQLQPATTKLMPLLRGVVEICRIQAEKKGLTFQTRLDEEIPQQVILDEKCLRQVLLNLLSNAVKFTKTGSVEFRVECLSISVVNELSCRLHFSILDTGVGMDAKEMESLFHAFEQVGEDSIQAQGTGLGLAISQQIVKLMGDEIRVRSQPAQGSEFTFELDVPIGNDSSNHRESHGGKVIGYKGKSKLILVVDDRVNNRNMIRSYLEPLGFLIHEACNGQEALESSIQYKPDLIITDLIMPGMDGHGFLELLRASPQFSKIPVFVASASVDAVARDMTLAQGGDEFIGKPINLDTLLDLLQKHLNLSWHVEILEHKPMPSVPQQSNLILKTPPLEDLQEMLRLVSIGRIRQFSKYVDFLCEQDSELSPFLNPLKGFAKRFEVRELESALQASLEK